MASDRHPSSRLDVALEDSRRLEAEVARLKGLLAKHNIDFEPPPARQVEARALQSAAEIDAVQGPGSKDEKVQLFRSLFRGREDVYAVRFRSKAGVWGYTPDGETDWNAPISISPAGRIKRPKNYYPVSDETIHQHLSGKKVIGLYPLLTDETCWFLAADFDKERWQDDALAFVDTARESGIHAYLERSRSGKGGHVWIFFLSPVLAVAARKLGCFVLTKTMERRHGVGLNSYK